MIVKIVLWSAVVLSLLAATGIFVLSRRFLPKKPSLAVVLGTAPLALLSLALTLTVAGSGIEKWVDAGEHHQVHPEDDWSSGCRFTWPTSTAPADQRADCPDQTITDTTTVDAVRAPGTEFVTLVGSDGINPLASPVQGAGLVLGTAGGVGLLLNVRRVKRVRQESEIRHLASWQQAVSEQSEHDGGDAQDLTWERIAELSEQDDVRGGPLADPRRYTDIPLTNAALTMGYPYRYVRVMTREAPGRCVLLLFVGDDAWRLDMEGAPARTGDATVSRVAASADLQVTIDGYLYDIDDDPLFLPAASLEVLRRHYSSWLRLAPSERIEPPTL